METQNWHGMLYHWATTLTYLVCRWSWSVITLPVFLTFKIKYNHSPRKQMALSWFCFVAFLGQQENNHPNLLAFLWQLMHTLQLRRKGPQHWTWFYASVRGNNLLCMYRQNLNDGSPVSAKGISTCSMKLRLPITIASQCWLEHTWTTFFAPVMISTIWFQRTA